MKFLLKFVSCYGSSLTSSDSVPEIKAASSSSGPLLPQPPSLQNYRRRRRRSAEEVEWKPSLCSISENNVIKEKTGTPENTVKRKRVFHTKVHVRSYSDDYGRDSMATIIPAFAPTPFMF